MKTIGVFDSGIGGKSVVNAIKEALPEYPIVHVDDKEHAPYGNKTPEELLKLVGPILNQLAQACDVIVVACNTVSTNLITELRDRIKIPLVAMEPMVKPAAEQTKTGVIAVCATPSTLASKRYEWLKETYAKDITVVEPDCSDWASMIEAGQIERQKISERIQQCLNENADVIVLGCTHYHWIEDLIQEIVRGKANVLQPEQPVIEQLKRVIAQLS